MATAKLDDRREVVAEQLHQVLFMRRVDASWHPCTVSLSLAGLGLDVEFEDGGMKAVIMTKEEAIELLRIRSDPLKGEDCSLIRQGDRVLATPKSLYQKVFFEAVVEERKDAKHTKKRCTCSFMVRWTGQVSGGQTTVLPLSAMMPMPATQIDIHPAIKAFLTNVSEFDEEELLDSPTPSIMEEGGASDNPTKLDGSSSTMLLQKNIAAKKESGSTKKTLNNRNVVRRLFEDNDADTGEGVKRKLFSCEEKKETRKSSRLNGSQRKKP